MASLKKQFKTSSKSAVEGITVGYGDSVNADGTIPKFKLARTSAQNDNYAKGVFQANDSLLKEYGVTEDKNLTPQQRKDAKIKLFCNTVLLGWENFYPEDDGVKLEYSKENAIAFFTNPDWYDFYEKLLLESLKQENFSSSLLENVTKN